MTITDYIEEAYAPKIVLANKEGEARAYTFRELTPRLLKLSVRISFSTKRMRERNEDGLYQAQALRQALNNVSLVGAEGEIVLVSKSPIDFILGFIELLRSRG